VCANDGDRSFGSFGELAFAVLSSNTARHSSSLDDGLQMVPPGSARDSKTMSTDQVSVQGKRGQASGHTNPCAAPWPSCRARRSSFRSEVWPWKALCLDPGSESDSGGRTHEQRSRSIAQPEDSSSYSVETTNGRQKWTERESLNRDPRRRRRNDRGDLEDGVLGAGPGGGRGGCA
jgi:hypothetical protein